MNASESRFWRASLSSELAKGVEESIALARRSVDEGGMPFGAVILVDGAVGARGRNLQIQTDDFFAHAEMVALRDWFDRHSSVPEEATLIATEAPCLMCAGAALNAGIRNFVVGEDVHFVGAVSLLQELGTSCTVLGDQECIDLVDEFRTESPDLWNRFSAG